MIDYLREELEQLSDSDRRCLMVAALNVVNTRPLGMAPIDRVMRATYYTLRELEDGDSLVAKAEAILREGE